MPSRYYLDLGGSSSNSCATTYRQSVCKVDETLKKVAKKLEQINCIKFEAPPVVRNIPQDHRGDSLPNRLEDAKAKDNADLKPRTGTGRFSGALTQLYGRTDHPTNDRRRGAYPYGNKVESKGTENPHRAREKGTYPYRNKVELKGTEHPHRARRKGEKVKNQPQQTPRSSGWPTAGIRDILSSQRMSTIKQMTSREQKRMEQSWKSSNIK